VNIPGVNPKILNPRDGWRNGEEYDDTLKKVASMFIDNFKKF
jgi:phosphoenolpyruvate carboxykinase (ATP)